MKGISKIKISLLTALAVGIFLVAQSAFSQQDPIEMLKGVTGQIMTELRQNEDMLREHPDKLFDLIDHIAIPHVDFTEMGKWVVGRNAWRGANDKVREQFLKEFQNLVVRSYGRSLLEYADYKIEFLPLRNKEEMLKKKRIEVSSFLKGEGRSLKMDYRLIDVGNEWKVFDIIMENVSIVQGYRAQFAEDIQRNGLAAVVKTIKEKNTEFNFTGKGKH